MLLRLRRKLLRQFYQFKGGVTGTFWLLVRGLEHYNARIQEFDERLKKAASEISDADERILWTTIGQALTAWATMEETLVTIVGILLRADGAKAGLIMYSIINFNVWPTLISDLFALDRELSPFQSRWNKIAHRIRKIKDVRDRLAHESTHKDPESAEMGTLKPSEFDSRQKTKLFKPLAQFEIVAFAETVADIARDTVSLCKEMMAVLEASAEKSPGPNPGHSPVSDAQ